MEQYDGRSLAGLGIIYVTVSAIFSDPCVLLISREWGRPGQREEHDEEVTGGRRGTGASVH
jgi:hypothetical protein